MSSGKSDRWRGKTYRSKLKYRAWTSGYGKRDFPFAHSRDRLLIPCKPINLGERAENGIRTRDPQLGKLMLYRLSYFREWVWVWVWV